MLLTLCWVLILIPIVILVVLGSLSAAVCLYILACQLRTPLLSLVDDACAYLFVEARVRRFLVRISHLKPLSFHQYYHGAKPSSHDLYRGISIVCDWWRTQQQPSGIPASIVVYLRLTCRTLSELEQLAATHLTLRAPLAPAGVAGAVSSPSRWRRVYAVSYLHRPEQLPTLMMFAAVWPNLRQLHVSKPQYLQLLHNTAAAAAVFEAGTASSLSSSTTSSSAAAAAGSSITRSPSKQLRQLQTDWTDWLAGPVAAAANSGSLAPLLNWGGGALGAALAATAAAASGRGASEALPQLQAALAAAAAAVVQLTTASTPICSTRSGSSTISNGSSQLGSANASNDSDGSRSGSFSVHGRMAFAGNAAAAANAPSYGPDGTALHLVAGIVLSGCRWAQLQSLSLPRLGLTPAAAQLLAQAAAQWPLLRLLNASHNKLGAAGLQNLLQAAASHWHNLEVLDVRGDRGAAVQHSVADDSQQQMQQQQQLGLLPAMAAAAAAAAGLCCEPWIGTSGSSSRSSSKKCVRISGHTSAQSNKPLELQGMLLDAATGSSSCCCSSMHWLGPSGGCSIVKDSSSSRRLQLLHLLV